ncbi:MAG: hypothetical protein ACI4M6_00750 [Christensenellaceae bacterium]
MQRIFLELKGVFSRRKNYVFVLVCCYAVGILLGMFLSGGKERALLTNNAIDFFVLVYSKDGNVIKLLLIRLFSSLGVLLLFYLLSFVVYTYCGHFILIFYRGYVLGAAAVTFLIGFKLSGVVLFIFCVMMQNAVCTFGLILFSAIMLDNLKSCKCRLTHFKQHLTALTVCFLLCAISALIEFIILICVLRPLNFYF